jgi:chorismate mutase / prephenate dehydrogenase
LPEHVDAIRWHIEETDNQIMDLIGQRMKLAKEMGEHKIGKGMPVRNLRVEEQVMARFASRAKQADVSEEAARSIAKILLHESEAAQFRMPRAEPKRITVIGGSGKMGAWLCRFFDSQGHRVMVNDIVSSTSFPYENDLKRAVSQADVVVVSTPIDSAKETLDKVLGLKPKGLVMDIVSIKAPIIPSLRAAAEKGMKVCSLHPMFGPDTTSLIYQNLLICDCGSKEGIEEAHALFDCTGAEIHEVKVEEHDKLMSYVLGMSHALNIAFFNALVNSGLTLKELEESASTTFRNQKCTSMRVANENPELYYQIQHVNPHSRETLDLLVKSIEEIRTAAMDKESDGFVRIMERGRAYYGGSE